MDHPGICQSCRHYTFDSRRPCAANASKPVDNLCKSWEQNDFSKITVVVEDKEGALDFSPDLVSSFFGEGRDESSIAKMLRSYFEAWERDRRRQECLSSLSEADRAKIEELNRQAREILRSLLNKLSTDTD